MNDPAADLRGIKKHKDIISCSLPAGRQVLSRNPIPHEKTLDSLLKIAGMTNKGTQD